MLSSSNGWLAAWIPFFSAQEAMRAEKFSANTLPTVSQKWRRTSLEDSSSPPYKAGNRVNRS